MTSVLNRRLPLNGSSIAGWFLLLALFSCGTPKKVVKSPDGPKKTSTEETDKVRVYDPATGTYVLIPRDAVKVDTVKHTEDTTDPVLTDKAEKPDGPVKKSHYEVSLFIPLNAENHPNLEGNIDSRLIRFMQYYGGMRIAAEEIEKAGLPVSFNSFDTESSLRTLNEILNDPAVKKSDIIIGPYDKENLEKVATYGLEKDKLVVSPWLPAFNIETENPNFIQVVPGLQAHADAIMDYISRQYKAKKIFLVARNNPTEIQRLQLFKKNTSVRVEDLIIDDESIDLAKTKLSFLLDDPDGTIFVMPYYSRQDENFVNSFMRKLHADQGTNQVIVFGLPQWTGFNNLNSNYMESLSVHISSPTYIDTEHPSYRSFRNKFYQKYFTLPDNQAYQGYDLLLWLARTIAREGTHGLMTDVAVADFGISTGFNLKPVFRENATKPSEMKTPLYYENGRLRILKYFNQDFHLAN